MHVVLEEAVRNDIKAMLTSEELAFEQDKSEAVDTHAKYALIHSFRQTGVDPHLQFVLNENVPGTERMSDADLDVGAFHRSSPAAVYEAFSTRWPEVAERYSFWRGVSSSAVERSPYSKETLAKDGEVVLLACRSLVLGRISQISHVARGHCRLKYHCTTAPLHHCTTALLHYCTTAHSSTGIVAKTSLHP